MTEGVSAESAPKTYTYIDPTPLMRWARGSLYLQAVLGVAAFSAEVYERYALTRIRDHAFSSRNEIVSLATQADTLALIAVYTKLAVYVIGGIIILCWIYRVAANTRPLGAKDLQMSAGMAVGSYFIPIACWVMPYIAMVEIWRASKDPHSWQTASRPWFLPVWWFLWLGSVGIALGVRLSLLDSKGVVQLLNANTFLLAYYAVNLVLLMTFVLIIEGITSMQVQHWNAQHGSSSPIVT